MSEYLVQRQSLENIADEIRVLSGTTEPLGLTEMATNVNDANDEVAAQATTIEEIMKLLEGKAVPGGGEDVTAEVTAQITLIDDLEAAVDALPNAGSGGELQIATGTFRPTIADMSKANVVISGLAFQPKYITIALKSGLTTPPTVGRDGFAAMKYYVTNLCYTETETAGQHIYRSSDSAAVAIIDSEEISRITLTPTADGFTITGSRIYWFTLDYQYIAVG